MNTKLTILLLALLGLGLSKELNESPATLSDTVYLTEPEPPFNTARQAVYDSLMLKNGIDTAAFKTEIRAVAAKKGFPEQWLYDAIYIESRFDPAAVNYQCGDTLCPAERAKKRATGLIQFLPSTALWIGTSNTAIRTMPAEQQVKYIEKYLARAEIKSSIDLSLFIFYPAAVGQTDDYVIGNDTTAAKNPAYDRNKDGLITVAEYKETKKEILP